MQKKSVLNWLAVLLTAAAVSLIQAQESQEAQAVETPASTAAERMRDLEARAAYQSAEESFAKKDYTGALNLLNHAAETLGRAPSRILALQIHAEAELAKSDTNYLVKTLQTIRRMENAPDFGAIAEDRMLEIMKLKLRLQSEMEARGIQDIAGLRSARIEALLKRKNQPDAANWEANPSATAAFLRQAAESGDAEAQYCFALLCTEGIGLPPDAAAARQWLQRAAEQNVASAVEELRSFAAADPQKEQARRKEEARQKMTNDGKFIPSFIGATLTTNAQPGAVKIESVLASGPGAKAGLREEDIILKADGQPIVSFEAFISTVSNTPYGFPLKLEVTRGGKQLHFTVEPQARTEDAILYGFGIEPEVAIGVDISVAKARLEALHMVSAASMDGGTNDPRIDYYFAMRTNLHAQAEAFPPATMLSLQKLLRDGLHSASGTNGTIQSIASLLRHVNGSEIRAESEERKKVEEVVGLLTDYFEFEPEINAEPRGRAVKNIYKWARGNRCVSLEYAFVPRQAGLFTSTPAKATVVLRIEEVTGSQQPSRADSLAVGGDQARQERVREQRRLSEVKRTNSREAPTRSR